MRQALNVEVKLIPGENGVFDVLVDGRRVFSRAETGRLPEPGEIAAKLKP